MDGHIHVRVDEDPAAFPVLQRRLDDAAASRHLCGIRGGRRIVFRWREDESKEGGEMKWDKVVDEKIKMYFCCWTVAVVSQ